METKNTSSITIDRRIVTPCEYCKNGCTMFNQSPCNCICHQPTDYSSQEVTE